MFTPPRCPNLKCPMHKSPIPDFFTRQGTYHPKCRAIPVPRFSCRACRRGFSRQTFRADYYDHKPHLNAPLMRLLASGLGLRQSGRLLHMSLHCIELKFRKMAKVLRDLHTNLLDVFRQPFEFELDELVTFEGSRLTRPLTLPVLIEARSLLVVAAASAPIRPSGKLSKRRRAALEREEKLTERRKDESRECLQKVFAVGAACIAPGDRVLLRTDEKPLYVPLAKAAFAKHRLRHERYSGKLPRTTSNPIFRINFTAALARDLNGRLRRRSWLASKFRRYLDLQLAVFMTYRNYTRRRVNRDKRTPAMKLGLLDRPLQHEQLLGWRQDWGVLSIHPASDGSSIAQVRAINKGVSA